MAGKSALGQIFKRFSNLRSVFAKTAPFYLISCIICLVLIDT